MQAKDISDKAVLQFLAERQGRWTSLWMGHFKGRENEMHMGHPIGVVEDVFFAFPEGTPEKVVRAKLKQLHRRGFIGGCTCGCRGDFEITDKGLEFLGSLRTKPYTGY